MARPSRPPGFDMSYRPAETSFGPPFVAHLPSIVYLGVAVTAIVLVFLGERAPAGSFLYNQVVERSLRGFIGARAVAGILLLGAFASLLKTGMRGVRIKGDGIDFRDVVSLGIPRQRRYKWAQIDRIVLDGSHTIVLELWDGSRAYLPEVNERDKLASALEMVGHARAIPVRGGTGLDELPEPVEESADENADEPA